MLFAKLDRQKNSSTFEVLSRGIAQVLLLEARGTELSYYQQLFTNITVITFSHCTLHTHHDPTTDHFTPPSSLHFTSALLANLAANSGGHSTEPWGTPPRAVSLQRVSRLAPRDCTATVGRHHRQHRLTRGEPQPRPDRSQ